MKRVAAIVAFAFCVAGCSSATASHPATVPARPAWTACGKGLECTRVSVPLDWGRPAEAQIELAVVRHRASRPQKRIGTAFFNPGGPGVSGVETMKAADAYLDALGGGRFDVVSWDPRGTGASTRVRCFSDEADRSAFWDHLGLPAGHAASERYASKMTAFARRCGETSGALLAHVATADTARDLEALRELFGEDRLTYVGWSYGTFLGVTYANMFPARVRAMVLDSVVDPIVYVSGREASNANTEIDTDLVLGKFETLCEQAGTARCALAGGGSVAARVSRLFATLRRAPIPAPAAPGGELSYGDTLLAFFARLRSPQDWPQLARDLKSAEGGDGSALENAALVFRSPAGYRELEPPIAIGCADSPARQGPRAWPEVIDRLTGISFLYGPVQGWWLWAPCASWPVASAGRYTGPWNAATARPVLIVANRYDPNTPLVNARRLERILARAVLLTNDGYGHVTTSDPSECIDRAIERYLVELATPARGAHCAPNHVPFDPKF